MTTQDIANQSMNLNSVLTKQAKTGMPNQISVKVENLNLFLWATAGFVWR
jgi:hypothetical protein